MTLDEAIQHCEEVAEKQEITAKSNLIEIDKIKADGILRLYDADEYESCMKCAEEHRQLAEWLKKLQAYEEAREKIELKADKCPNPEIRYGMRSALYVQEKCLEEVNANENSD